MDYKRISQGLFFSDRKPCMKGFEAILFIRFTAVLYKKIAIELAETFVRNSSIGMGLLVPLFRLLSSQYTAVVAYLCFIYDEI